MNDKLLEVRSLRKKFIAEKHIFKADKLMTAVDNVSFHIEDGETMGLIGSSGCGKSTLAKMIVGLLKPDEGEVFFEGKDIGRLSGEKMRRLRPRLQMIQQNPFSCFNPRRKIINTLMDGIIEHRIVSDKKEGREYILGTILKCGLSEEHLDRYPSEFSGGQLQRLAISRAVLLKPVLIIADEIVSALDISIQDQILELLMQFKTEREMSMLFISHDLAVIKKISDRIIVMDKGKIIDSGETDYIFRRSDNEYTNLLRESMVPFNYL